jgi:hypothetical protein
MTNVIVIPPQLGCPAHRYVTVPIAVTQLTEPHDVSSEGALGDTGVPDTRVPSFAILISTH